MKKLYLLVILYLISSSAHAAWIKVWESDASQYFVQSETMKYKSKLAHFWLLTNNHAPDESGYLSYKQKIEIDCEYNQLRLVAQIGYEKKMGLGGSNRFRKAYEEWEEILPDSLGGELFRYVCLKK
jgi:hypothetical protein